MTPSSESTTGHTSHPSRAHCGASRGRGGNWSCVNIAAMVLGFVFFWPIGLFILMWIITGRDVQELPGAARRLWSNLAGAWEAQGRPAAHGPSDNAVFDEYQQAQYERIREIKDEIRERTRRFAEFRARAKRRSDEDEFNRFMSDAPPRGDG